MHSAAVVGATGYAGGELARLLLRHPPVRLVVVDAKSGVSGAGHTVDEAFLFGTINESVRAYGVPKHRHTPEIAQGIADVTARPPRLTFTPHLIPITRGLVATCYADLKKGVT